MTDIAAMAQALEEFFDNAGDSSAQNVSRFRYAITRWQDSLIPTGLEVIHNRLRRIARSTLNMRGTEGDRLIQDAGVLHVAIFQDVIVDTGSHGLNRLVELLNRPDEDIAALAALELSTDTLKNQKALQPLLQAFKRAKGTGFRLALAIALLSLGEVEPIKAMAVPYLTDQARLSSVANILRQANPSANQKDIETVLYTKVAFPLGLKLVVWDIATDGLGPKYIWSTWKRA